MKDQVGGHVELGVDEASLADAAMSPTLAEFGPSLKRGLGLSRVQLAGLIGQAMAAGATDPDVPAGALREFWIRMTDGFTLATIGALDILGLEGRTAHEAETAQQWDDEYWRIWEDARQAAGGDAEKATRHADLEMSERHGPRPDGFSLTGAPTTTERGRVGMEEILAAYSVPPAMLGTDDRKTIKLTRWQRTELAAKFPESDDRYGPGRELARLTGIPIELVDTELESDLPMFVPPPVRIVPEPRRGWLGRLLDRVFG